jgi:hypothetical protein
MSLLNADNVRGAFEMKKIFDNVAPPSPTRAFKAIVGKGVRVPGGNVRGGDEMKIRVGGGGGFLLLLLRISKEATRHGRRGLLLCLLYLWVCSYLYLDG